MKYSRHAACGMGHSHSSQLITIAQRRAVEMKWATSAKLESLLEVHVAVEVRFDAAILLAHLAHALRGRAQSIEWGRGRGKGEQHCFVAPGRA